MNIASVAGLRPAPGIAYYGVSKSALIGLTVQLAAELAPQVRVNAVAPAVVKTRFAAALYEADEAEAAAAYPLGRLGEPEDIGAAVAFLASADAAWITGQTLVIDGGAAQSRSDDAATCVDGSEPALAIAARRRRALDGLRRLRRGATSALDDSGAVAADRLAVACSRASRLRWCTRKQLASR